MNALGVDEGLLRRLRDAGRGIVWVPTAGAGRGPDAPRTRLARLNEEEARVETLEGPDAVTIETGAGPVGALVLLLEADRRGPFSSLGSRNTSSRSRFPDGSIVARWGAGELVVDARPTVRDLVSLARYALP